MHNTKKKKTFSSKDYISGDGMVTSTWGPAAWHFLHTISFNYPVEPTEHDKQSYRNYVLSLKNVLPCKYCRINFKKNLKQMPLTMAHMKDRASFSRYIYQLHELINRMLHKKSDLTYCDVRERYEHFRSRCTQNEETAKLFRSKDIAKNIQLSKEKGKTNKQNNRQHNKTSKTKKHSGCTEPLWGTKSKCIIKIVPQTKKIKSFSIDQKCMKKRV